MTETRRTYCGLCHPRCGLRLEIENGRAVNVTGDPDHPITRGRICNRGKLMLDHVYHPDRLNYPLKRKGERGGGQWERVPWDQALDEVAEKLATLRDRHGAETLAFSHGTKRTYHWDERRFFNLFGSPNVFGANNVCMCPSQAVEYATYGGFAWGDVMQAKCVVLWGHGPSQSDPIGLYPMILGAKKNGARLIVVDPRRIPEWWMSIMDGGSRSARRPNRSCSAYSSPMPTCFALTGRSSAAPRSAGGPIAPSCAGWKSYEPVMRALEPSCFFNSSLASGMGASVSP
jgi:thiosulfate reductase / polysulfide reductase chain A